jgi:hypothetical protein
MIDEEYGPDVWPVVRRTPGHRPAGTAGPRARRAARVTAASAAEQVLRWADEFADVLRAEIRDAERRDVISVGEGEQLLARLVVVLDQAVTPSWAP